jgi:hypothetical protein
MSEPDRPTANELLCPFGEILDRRVLGEATDEDRARLEEHVAQGCPTCVPRYQNEEHLEALVLSAMRPLEEEIERRRGPVLDELKERIAREDERRGGRRRRRLALNTLLFATVVGGVALLSIEFLAYAAIKGARIANTKAEVRALQGAVERYARENAGDLPRDDIDLLPKLARHRTNSDRPYYEVDKIRIDHVGRLLDPWHNPYVYHLTSKGPVVYSMGPNGRDDGGLLDDIAPPSSER